VWGGSAQTPVAEIPPNCPLRKTWPVMWMFSLVSMTSMPEAARRPAVCACATDVSIICRGGHGGPAGAQAMSGSRQLVTPVIPSSCEAWASALWRCRKQAIRARTCCSCGPIAPAKHRLLHQAIPFMPRTFFSVLQSKCATIQPDWSRSTTLRGGGCQKHGPGAEFWPQHCVR
jgi:hypothetical protein